ncbi:MAG: RES family NAD+ phosphorylase [Gammaproteobacteria bacterium]|nr:RES family NAD+ phosphorylase [Gammaproteobacteria bacterium]
MRSPDPDYFNSRTRLKHFGANVWRMVETQETAATLKLVETMEEQQLLEQLLDEVKPPYRPGTESRHYLIKTAFRYPPLKYGSRFGTRAMPSFFYASEQSDTVLAETAYYRFVFMHDMAEPYAAGLDSRHSMFRVTAKTDRCLDLSGKKYAALRSQLTDPVDYRLCQQIGKWAVEEKAVEIIRFESARLAQSYNVAIASPTAIRSRAPNEIQSWLCRTTMQRISFSSRERRFPVLFNLSDYLVNGQLPRPS